MAYISRKRKTQDAGNEPGPDLLRQEVRRGRGKQVRAVRRVGRAPHVAVRGQPRRPERPARPLDAAPPAAELSMMNPVVAPNQVSLAEMLSLIHI